MFPTSRVRIRARCATRRPGSRSGPRRLGVRRTRSSGSTTPSGHLSLRHHGGRRRSGADAVGRRSPPASEWTGPRGRGGDRCGRRPARRPSRPDRALAPSSDSSRRGCGRWAATPVRLAGVVEVALGFLDESGPDLRRIGPSADCQSWQRRLPKASEARAPPDGRAHRSGAAGLAVASGDLDTGRGSCRRESTPARALDVKIPPVCHVNAVIHQSRSRVTAAKKASARAS